MTPSSALPPAPTAVVDPTGAPAFGTYQGPFAVVDLRRLTAPHALGPVDRVRHHKKWVYLFAADDQVSVLCAIVDTTYASTAFVMVTDMRSGDVVADHSVMGGPGPMARVGDHPAAGLHASFRSPSGLFALARPSGRDPYRLTIDSAPIVGALASAVGPATRPAVGMLSAAAGAVPRVGGRLRGAVERARASAATRSAAPSRVRIDLSLDPGHTPELSVVAPVREGGGSVNVTQKVAGLPTTGTVRVGDRAWQLTDAIGGLDYTHGYLARHTAWNWAFLVGRLGDGTRLGLNLVAGFNESRPDVNENALWLGDRLIPLDRARFAWDRSDPMATWTVRTVDGSVDLRFTPLGVHSERKDLVILTSRFIQPVGVFSGTIRAEGVEHTISSMPGVTEDQDVRW
jgi:hypothetical protein